MIVLNTTTQQSTEVCLRSSLQLQVMDIIHGIEDVDRERECVHAWMGEREQADMAGEVPRNDIKIPMQYFRHHSSFHTTMIYNNYLH